jgi:hypothetical protein
MFGLKPRILVLLAALAVALVALTLLSFAPASPF